MKQIKRIAALALCVVLAVTMLTAARAVTMGDADGDGRLTPADARLVLRFSVNLDVISPATLPYCDMDRDSRITPADARLVLRYSIGLFTESGGTSSGGTSSNGNSSGGSGQTGQQQEQTQPEQQQTDAGSRKENYIRNISNAISKAEILDNFQIFTQRVGSRWYTTDGIVDGRKWVSGILDFYGYPSSDIILDYFTYNDVNVCNVYAEIPTKVSNPDIILFVAHYDSYYTGAGAVDNASGLCTVLEIARVLKALNIDFGVEVRFLFTACEELGYHGAYRYVDYFSPRSLSRHVAVFNVDMSAHFDNDTPHYLTVSTKSAYGSNAKANKPSLAVDAAKEVVGSCGEYKYMNPVAAGLHDLIPFDKKGLPTITLSWREINYDNSHGSQDGLAAPAEIHSSYDVYENVDLDSLYATTRLAVGAAAALIYDYLY